MTFQNIRYFLAIVEEGTISAAARRLYISQQTLSEHLKKLEEEVGTPLFDRGRRMSLTAAGACFYNGGKELISIYEGMLSDVRDITDRRRSKITVAVPTSRMPPYFPELLARYQRRYPAYEVAVIKRQHSDVARNMQGVDLYLSCWPLPSELERHVLLARDPCCAVFRRSLAEQVFGRRWPETEAALARTGDLSLLRELPFLLLRDRYGQMAPDLAAIFREYGFTPIAGCNSETSELNEQMCDGGAGCLLAPESTARLCFFENRNVRPDGLLCCPIRVTSFETSLAVCYEKGKRLHAAEICFLREADACFAEWKSAPLPALPGGEA